MSRWLAASFVVLSACGGKSLEKLTDERRPKIEPVLAKLAALAPAVKAAPPVTTDGFTLPAGAKVDFDLDYGNVANANAAVVYAGALTEPCSGGDYLTWDSGRQLGQGPLDQTTSWLRDPACLMKTGKGRFGAEDLDRRRLDHQFTLLEQLRYVLVVRPTTLVQPVIKNASEFSPGMISGDAKLYELATGKDLGGIKFTYASSEQIKVVGSSQQTQVEEDLIKETALGIAKQLQENKMIKAWP